MNYKQAFAVGLIAPGVMAVREPVAYLYNGVRLPGLPEWDKTVYPYAFVGTRSTDGAVCLVCVSARRNLTDTGILSVISGTRTIYVLDGSAWAVLGSSATFQGAVTWSNYDVYAADGTLYLTASDPIPVYS